MYQSTDQTKNRQGFPEGINGNNVMVQDHKGMPPVHVKSSETDNEASAERQSVLTMRYLFNPRLMALLYNSRANRPVTNGNFIAPWKMKTNHTRPSRYQGYNYP